MSAPIPLRQDFGCVAAAQFSQENQRRSSGRRLLALAAIYDGATRTEAAKIGRRRASDHRDWVLRFNARGPDALLNGKSPGKPSKLNDLQRQAIAGMIESGPIPAVHGVVALAADRSGAMDLRGIPHHDRQADAQRELRAMGYRKLSARPRQPCASAGRDRGF